MAALKSKGKKAAILHWIVSGKHGICPYYDRKTNEMKLRKGSEICAWDGKYVIDKEFTKKKSVVGYILGDSYTVAMVENALRVQLTDDAIEDIFGRTCFGISLGIGDNEAYQNIPPCLSKKAYQAMQELSFGKDQEVKDMLAKLDNKTRIQILKSIKDAYMSYRSAQETNLKELLVLNSRGEIDLVATMEKVLSHALFFNPEWVMDNIAALGCEPAIKLEHEGHKNNWLLNALGVDPSFTARYNLKDPQYNEMLKAALKRINTGASGTAEYDIQGIIPLHNSLEEMGFVLIGPLAMRLQGKMLDDLLVGLNEAELDEAKEVIVVIRRESSSVVTKFTNMVTTLSKTMGNVRSRRDFESSCRAQDYYKELGHGITLAMSAIISFIKASPTTEQSRGDLRNVLYNSVIDGLIHTGKAREAGEVYVFKDGIQLVMQQILQELPIVDLNDLARILSSVVVQNPSFVDAQMVGTEHRSVFITF